MSARLEIPSQPDAPRARRSARRWLLLGVAVLLVALGADAHPGARPRRQAVQSTELEGSYRVGRSPYAVRFGHFDDDDLLDVITANVRGESLSVLLSAEPGRPHVRVDTPTGGLTVAVAVGDLDGDGRDDAAAAVHTPTPHLALFTGRGRGGLVAGHRVALPGAPTDVVIHDLDGDGRAEVVVSMNADELAVIHPAQRGEDGAPAVERIAVPDCGGALGQAADGVAVGDFDGDARPDLGVACLRDWSLQLQLATDRPGPTHRVARIDPALAERWVVEFEGRADAALVGSVRKLRFADLDGDRFDELVGVVEYGHLLVAWGGANGGGGMRLVPFGISGSNTVVPADLDGDGRPELLVVSGHDPELVAIRWGEGREGEIEVRRVARTPETPESLDVADLDGDGVLDVVVAGEHGSAVRYLRGDGEGGFAPFPRTGG